MIRRWHCMNGHSGDGAIHACPACGLPVSVRTVKDPAPVGENTLVGEAPSAAQVQDLIFSEVNETLPPVSPSRQRAYEVPNGFRASPPVNASPEETLQKPLGAGESRSIEPPTILPPPRPTAPLSNPDETLQKPASIAPQGPPTERAFAAPSSGVPTSPLTHLMGEGPTTAPAPPNHGETLVRPSESSASRAATQVPQASLTGYEILGVLGRGGMGVVYKARQVGLNRLVALKMILSGAHASSEELMRFRIEAEAVARLRHPNIVQIFDIGERDGRPFFALEYCEGGSLQQKLDGTPMQPRLAAALMATLASAMDHAHGNGIVHRDLKPANILLMADGSPKITDFGLAKRLDDDQGQTGDEAVLGTPTYMAPEQAQGKTRQVGPQADLYALGAILYDLLTGRPPFRGTTALDTIQMVQTAEPIPPSRLQPGVPADLQTICLKCLEKDPAKRYAGAAALAEDLRAFIEGRPIQARPSTAFERAWKWARRKPALAGLVGLAVLTPLVVAAVSLGFTLHLSGLNDRITQQNDDLEGQTIALEKNNIALGNEKEKLETKQRELVKASQELKEGQDELRAALAREGDAKREAQRSSFEAQEAIADLIKIARVELRRPGSEGVRRVILQRAVTMCKQFTDRPGDYPVARLGAARSQRLTGDLKVSLGELPAAIKNYDTASGLYAGLIRDGAKAAVENVDYRAESLDLAVQLWAALVRTNAPRAKGVLDDTLSRLAGLDASTRERPEYLRPHAILVGNRGLVRQLAGELSPARKDYDRAIGWLAALTGPDAKLERARLLVHRASLTLQSRGDTGLARKDSAEAISSLRKMAEPSDDPMIAAELGRAYSIDAGLAAQGGDLEAARGSYQDAVDLLQKLHERAPLVPNYAHLLAVARGELGSHLLLMKRTPAARKELGESLAALRKLAKRPPGEVLYRFDLGRIETSQGVALVHANELPDAVLSFEAAESAFAALVESQPDRPDIRLALLGVYRNLIYCHTRQAHEALDRGSSQEAERHVAQLLTLRKKYEDSIPPAREASTWAERARRWKELLLMRYEQIGTLRALVEVLETERSYERMAQAVAEFRAEPRPLVDALWPENLRSAATLSRAMALANLDRARPLADRSRLAARYGKMALALLEPLASSGLPDLNESLEGADFAALRKAYPKEVQRLQTLWQRATKSQAGR